MYAVISLLCEHGMAIIIIITSCYGDTQLVLSSILEQYSVYNTVTVGLRYVMAINKRIFD